MCNYFNSLFQAESECKNSNFGGKSIELLIQCRFPNKFDFKKVTVVTIRENDHFFSNQTAKVKVGSGVEWQKHERGEYWNL